MSGKGIQGVAVLGIPVQPARMLLEVVVPGIPVQPFLPRLERLSHLLLKISGHMCRRQVQVPGAGSSKGPETQEAQGLHTGAKSERGPQA